MSLTPKESGYLTYAPFVKASDVFVDGTIICRNCKQRHAVFYRRHSKAKRTLNYRCDKIARHNVPNSEGDWDYERLFTHMGECELVDGLPVPEEWTPKYRESFQKEHHDNLIQ